MPRSIAEKISGTAVGRATLLLALTLVASTSCTRSSPRPKIVVLGEDFSNTSALERFREEDEKALGVDLEFVKNTFDVFNQKANADLASGTGLYDVILHYSSVLTTYGRNRWVLTVEEQKSLFPEGDYSFEGDIFPEVWRDSSFVRLRDGAEPVALGYPFCGNTMVLVYNRQLFEDPNARADFLKAHKRNLQPPATWQEFREVAEFFTDRQRKSYGVVLQGASGSPLYWEWVNFAFGLGDGVMAKRYGWDGTPTTPLLLTSPRTVKATEFYLSLRPFNAGDFFSTGQAEQQEIMKSKDVAMAIMWSDSLFALVDGGSGSRFGFAPVPGGKSLIGGGTFFINRKSAHARDAVRYVARAMQRRAQVAYMSQGLTSALSTAYSEPAVTKLPYSRAVLESLERAQYMLESGPDAGLILSEVEKAVQGSWRGEATAAVALAGAQEAIEAQRVGLFSLSGATAVK